MFDRTVENLRDAVHFIDDVVVDEKLFSVEKYNVIVRTPSRFRTTSPGRADKELR